MSKFKTLISVSALVGGALAITAYAADAAPSWATALPYGTLSCSEQSSSGVEWKEGSYRSVTYAKNRYSISRLTREEIAKNLHFCKDEDRIPASLMGVDRYGYSACYRFDNALNMLGSAQGWCSEIYRKDQPTQVLCEFSEPVLAFTPAGEFVAYGGSRNIMGTHKPFMPAAFVARGICGGFTDTPPKPLGKFK